MSLQFIWRVFVFFGEFELSYILCEVNDRVFVRIVVNLYFFGVVIIMKDGKVYIQFDDGNVIIYFVIDVLVVILDKLFDFMILKRNSYVIVLCESFFYYIGYVDISNYDGNVGVVCDECGDICIFVDKVRLFFEYIILYEVGVRVFVWWINGLYYCGFIIRVSDWNVFVNYDDGDIIILNK